MTNPSKLRVHPRQLLGFAFILVAWWFLARWLGPARLPAPEVVFSRLITVLSRSPELAAQGGGSNGIGPHLLASIQRVFLGGSIGLSLGVAMGLAMGWLRPFRELLQPSIEILRAVPPLAIAPLLLIWFGPTATTQYIMLIGYTFLAIVINTLEAIKNVPSTYVQYAKTMGASDVQIFRTVMLPAILPELVGGVRVAVALSWGIAVVTELLGAPLGIGRVFSMMLTAQGLDIIIIGIIYVSLVALVTDQLIAFLGGRATRWVPRAQR